MGQNSLVAQRFVYEGVVKEDGIFKIVNNKKLMEHVKRPHRYSLITNEERREAQIEREKGGSNRTKSSSPKTLKYWVGVQRGHSYLMGRRCLFSLGWAPF